MGDWVQLTFVVRDGTACGFVNGQRSGACSKPMIDSNRQLGTGEPLEVGGEDTYGSHPLWNLGEYNLSLSLSRSLALCLSLCLALFLAQSPLARVTTQRRSCTTTGT